MTSGVLVDKFITSSDDILHKHNENAQLSIFPDGIRTSGQHAPLYDALKPYSAFPTEITGPTLWHREEYQDHPERWVHVFSEDAIAELSSAADAFISQNIPLTGISKTNFPLGSLAQLLEALRHDLLNGKGFVLFKNFPASKWTRQKTATAYMGLGTWLGYFLSQNSLGHVLGHVKDVGDDPTQIQSVRIYRTTAKQFFHTDDGDLVGLLCLHRALDGGESDLVSAHAVWNYLQRHHPDVAELLVRPVWYFDRKGEVSDGQEGYTLQPVFYLENSPRQRVYVKWDPNYVRSLQRFHDSGDVPPLSAEQVRALEMLDEVCTRLALHMVLEVGDIQFLSNAHILHARTAYTDYPPPLPRRHLLRLWLATPETEDGWSLPMPDSKEKKRGGIQVNDTPPKAPLDAE